MPMGTEKTFKHALQSKKDGMLLRENIHHEFKINPEISLQCNLGEKTDCTSLLRLNLKLSFFWFANRTLLKKANESQPEVIV